MKTRFAQLGITVFCFLSYFAVALFGCSSTTAPVKSAQTQTVPVNFKANVQPVMETMAIPYEDMLYPGAKEWLRQLKRELNVHAWYISGFCMKKTEVMMQSKTRMVRTGKWASIENPNKSNS